MNTFIQISDCHISDKPFVIGAYTQYNLKKIVEEISKEKYEALLITGDVSHDGTIDSYKVTHKILSKIKKPIAMTLGNHDDEKNLNEVFSKNFITNFSIANWEVIIVNSTVKGEVSGYLDENKLIELDKLLSSSAAKYNIIAMHHPPVSMCSNWDDSLSLKNPQDLFNLINKYSKIKAVIWGHAHQAAEFIKKDVKLISCPSTAVQYGASNINKSGFNKYKIYANGKIECTTIWL